MALCNIGNWTILRSGSVYRKFDLYFPDFTEEANLDYWKIFPAQFGGPIACIRDKNKLVPISGTSKPIIKILDNCGQLISQITWTHGPLFTLGWSGNEELLCIQEDGFVHVFDMFGEYKRFFSMGKETNQMKILGTKVFNSSSGTGLAVMTRNFRLFLVNNINDQKTRQFPEIPKSPIDPSCWNIVAEERNSFCLIARETNVYTLNQGQSVCGLTTNLLEKPFQSFEFISVSHNQKLISLYTNNGLVWIGTADMKTKYCEFDTGRDKERPRQVEWIPDSELNGQSEAIAITYNSLLLILNIKGDTTAFSYDPVIQLVPEIDGVRIITNSSHEMLQKVPKCVNNIFALYSQTPSNLLFQANKEYEEKSHKSDDYLSFFRDKMDEAVDECIEAAGYEFDPDTQKTLMKAAYFGKGFISGHNPDKYIKMCRIIRVLNTLRGEKISMPLTYNQFNQLSASLIIARLVFRKHYAIAIQIAKHLKLPEHKILEHWAMYKVEHDHNDEEVARKITDKFTNPLVEGICFYKIAEKAHFIGKPKLALRLLDLEPKASRKVPLLLKVGEGEAALKQAVESGDTDLMMRVVLQLKETSSRNSSNFQMLIRRVPTAYSLYKSYCKFYSKNDLLDCYIIEDDHEAMAEYNLKEAIENHKLESNLSEIERNFLQGQRSFDAEMCNETSRLYKLQQMLSDKHPRHGVNFYELTVNGTLTELFRMDLPKLADKLKSDFKISERTYWMLKIKVLGEQYKWDELEKLSKSKRSPCGYEPFVDTCLGRNNLVEAKKYLPKCKSYKTFVKAGLLDEAVQMVFEQRDLHSLQILQVKINKTDNQQLKAKIEQYISQESRLK
ncbi:VPS16 family protein [Megaselia abdita]